MWLASVSGTATLVALLSGLATIGSFFAYLYAVQRSNANAAREEALALAETRRQVIAECEKRVRRLERELVRPEDEAQVFRRGDAGGLLHGARILEEPQQVLHP